MLNKNWYYQQKGFTLIELMIVVGIIAVILAIAIPSLMRSRIQANEAATIEELRVIASGQISYSASKNTFGSFEDLISEVDGQGTAFIDTSWVENREKAGYRFSMAIFDENDFVCYADPIQLGTTGTRFFRIDPSGIVRYNYTARPAADDTAIGS